MEKLTIAKYKNGYIKISDYNRSIHKQGEIFCPFCNPLLEVTGVQNTFFRALPGRGGHNCKRTAIEYFNANWEGRKLVETLSGNEGNLEIVIDFNTLKRESESIDNEKIVRLTDNLSTKEIEKYNKYTNYKKVFRDIIRTVSQMKNLLEKNTIDELQKIKFKYKIGDEELGINEVVILADELTKRLNFKERFVIYIVQSVKVSKGKLYINSYEIGGKNITTSFAYKAEKNKTNIKKDDIVIAFGKINYYEGTDRYYLNTLSDLNVSVIKDKDLRLRFSSKEIKENKLSNDKKQSTDYKLASKANSQPNIKREHISRLINVPERKKDKIEKVEVLPPPKEIKNKHDEKKEAFSEKKVFRKMIQKFSNYFKRS
ncbi:hypothetical protein [Paenibacillus shenyangensis]|uniref:hypothetical protein n=1 Tax=Paenibacillus sp. A9 TaxID=1284352 RepID=UPI0003637621|nr:hypothetical protein [Paenibacillus sp. A9]